jgi:large subunit ribosomal protein L10
MKRSDKELFVEEFSDRIRSAPVFYLTDFSGLDVKSMTVLRDRLHEAGADYTVVKNRLVIRALEALDGEIPDLSEYLKGPTGVIIAEGDVVTPAKALTDFAKEHGDRPVFKVGVLDQSLLEAEKFKRLAELPSREELLAELAGALEAPMSLFAMALEAKIQETAGLLDALRNQKSEEE